MQVLTWVELASTFLLFHKCRFSRKGSEWPSDRRKIKLHVSGRTATQRGLFFHNEHYPCTSKVSWGWVDSRITYKKQNFLEWSMNCHTRLQILYYVRGWLMLSSEITVLCYWVVYVTMTCFQSLHDFCNFKVDSETSCSRACLENFNLRQVSQNISCPLWNPNVSCLGNRIPSLDQTWARRIRFKSS